MIKITDLTKKFGKKKIFESFNANFGDNGIVILTGESGRGKTTLLRLIAGLDKKHSGKIEFSFAPKISYVFQEPRLLPSSDALENVMLPIENNKENTEKALLILKRLGLESDIHTYPDEMSGGMKQRVGIARAFAYSGNILLLDEPFSALDKERVETVIEMIEAYSKNNLCILVTHNTEQLKNIDCTFINL